MAIGKLLQAETALVEEYGEVVAATGTYLVEAYGTDQIDMMIRALAYPFLPVAGTALHVSAPYVRCVRREPVVLGETSIKGVWHIKVICQFELQRDQSVDASLPIRVGGTLSQISTEVDLQGFPITVTYKDETILKEVDVLDYQTSFQIQLTEQPGQSYDGIAEPNTMDGIARAWIGYVNAGEWRNGQAGTWLCTDVSADLVNRFTNPPTYNVTYTFLWKSSGHKYTVVYRDRDGNVPEDVDEGSGITTVTWHPEKNFNAKFGFVAGG